MQTPELVPVQGSDLCSLWRIGQGSSHRKATGQNGSAIVYLRTVLMALRRALGHGGGVCAQAMTGCRPSGEAMTVRSGESRESASGKIESSIKLAATDL